MRRHHLLLTGLVLLIVAMLALAAATIWLITVAINAFEDPLPAVGAIGFGAFVFTSALGFSTVALGAELYDELPR